MSIKQTCLTVGSDFLRHAKQSSDFKMKHSYFTVILKTCEKATLRFLLSHLSENLTFTVLCFLVE